MTSTERSVTQAPGAPSRGLLPPWGGVLPDLLVHDDAHRAELLARAARAPALTLDPRGLADFECLATGAYAPLRGFLGRADHAEVLASRRLADGRLWPMPVALPVPVGVALAHGQDVALRGPEQEILGLLTAVEVYDVSPAEVARALWGPRADEHPLRGVLEAQGTRRVGGTLHALRLPRPGPFADLRLPPAEVRRRLLALGAGPVVAFQTRNPLHRAHEWITKAAQRQVGGVLLVHPTVGPALPDGIDDVTRLRAIQALVAAHYDPRRTLLASVPLPMWLAGPREALFHALVRRNFGADHLIVGRDHAGPGRMRDGTSFFPPEAAQEAVAAHAHETGVDVVPFGDVVWLPAEQRFERAERVPAGAATESLSGTETRSLLASGRPLPTWLVRPETAALLAEAEGAWGRRGVCVWLTGLPASGKSTLAQALAAHLEERGRRVTLLDGDPVRALLSKGLGFSREDRDANVARLAFVAAEVVRHHGIAIVAAVSPYEAAREAARAAVGPARFLLVHLATALPVCEARDSKGLYARARRGEARGVTGIDDPYEPPRRPELSLDAGPAGPADLLRPLVARLRELGVLAG